MSELSVEISVVTEATKSKTAKVTLITFFDVTGVMHSEFSPHGQTINERVYKEIRAICLARNMRCGESCGRTKRAFFST